MSTIRLSRLDGARRQLHTALELFFTEADPVSIHTLVCAAYEVIHDLNRKAKGPPLLFDAPNIKKGMEQKAREAMKAHAGFFKHADGRGGRVASHIDFDPGFSELFFLGALLGIKALGHEHSDPEAAYLGWRMLAGSDSLGQHGEDVLSQVFGRESLEEIRGIEKHEFFYGFLAIREAQRAAGGFH